MINHLFFVLKHLITFLFVKLPLNMLGFAVVGLVLVFYIRDKRVMRDDLLSQRFPKLLSWWDNGDERDMKYGLNGDPGYQYRFLLADGSDVTAWAIYKMRYNWLAWRNPLGGFQHNVLGVEDGNRFVTGFYNATYSTTRKYPGWKRVYKSLGPDSIWTYDTMEEVGDWYYPGFSYRAITINHQELREYYVVYIWPKWMQPKTGTQCLRIRFGYKIGHNPLQVDADRTNVQWVAVFQPWKKFLGNL